MERQNELLKAELLATVSHELRTPLASITGYTATLLRHEHRLAPEERHEFLLAIQRASQRLERIVDRLLEMSQLETGTISIERSTVDAVRLAREALIAAEQRAAALSPGHFTFHLRLKDASGRPVPDEPLILADPRRLRQVLDQLLENAMSYSPQGGAIDVVMYPLPFLSPQDHMPDRVNREATAPQGTGDAGVEQTDAPPAASQPPEQEAPQMIEVCVCDHGTGIPSDHLERIFERFHRVDTRLTREVNGLGLGLTICKHLVELHGGVIWAESCPAGGSAFHVRLPIDEEEQHLAPLAGASST